MIEWDHNTHYHKLLFSKLPETRDFALDVGSGFGLFSFKLTSLFKAVLSLEPDKGSIDFQKSKYETQDNITFVEDSFLKNDFKGQKFDFISAIASIHHMDFVPALIKIKALLKPGGKMVILGLYKESSIFVYIISIIAFFPNLFMTFLFRKGKDCNCEMTVTPETSIKDIKQLSKLILNNCQLNRLLFWRYLLVYEKPCSQQSKITIHNSDGKYRYIRRCLAGSRHTIT